MKNELSKMNIDEAKERKGKLGMSGDDFEKVIRSKQDDLFTDLRSLIFQWKVQPDNEKKLMSRLPNGKVVFLDRYDNPEDMKTDTPYICAVYERESEAFAKVVCEEYKPKINVLPSHIVTIVYKDKNKTKRIMPGPEYKNYEERIIYCIKKCEKLGFPEVSVEFKGNRKRTVV
jgi:hypothetical protein